MSSWSPELLKSPSDVGLEHDIWGLGVLYYRFLTGKWPFYANNFGEYYELVVNGDYNTELLSEYGVGDFEVFLLKRLFEVDPDDRLKLSNLNKLCRDYLEGIFEKLKKFPELKEKYLRADGYLWHCPRCHEVTYPFDNICSECGYRTMDWLSLKHSL